MRFKENIYGLLYCVGLTMNIALFLIAVSPDDITMVSYDASFTVAAIVSLNMLIAAPILKQITCD